MTREDNNTGPKLPEALRPFACHGVDLRPGVGESQDWVGDCPFCAKRKHLFVSPRTGQWDCKVCGSSGNAVTFLGRVAEAAAESTDRARMIELSKQRGIPTGVMRAAGVGWSGSEWLIPVRSDAGTVRDIGRWHPDRKGVLSTAGCKSQLWNADKLATSREGSEVWLCEGAWDGMAAEWLLRDAGVTDVTVVAVPGALTFKSDWASLFAGRRVVTFYDSDDAGDRGQVKAHRALSSVAESLEHSCWPEDSPEGWDLRDFAKKYVPSRGAAAALKELRELRRPFPRRDTGDGTDGAIESGPPSKLDDDKLPDVTFADVVAAFKKHLHVTPNFEMAIKVVLAVCLSNDVRDNPIWLYLMGPAAAGKTEILTAMQASRRCVFRSKITPNCLISGWRGEGAKDPSLIPKLKGKTLIAKDFTEILSMPEVAQREIYSTLRGAYDGYADKSFGNGMERHYSDCQFSIVAGATPAILKHRESAMGERFVKYRLRSLAPREADDRARMALDSIGSKSKKDGELQKVCAAFLKRKLPKPSELPDHSRMQERIIGAARTVAAIRAQVERDARSGDPQYRPEKESPDRLIKQFGLLAKILAWIDGKDEIDEDVAATIDGVALDTVCGFDLDIIEAMMKMGGSSTRKDLAAACSIPSSTVARRLDDLAMTNIVEVTEGKSEKAGGRPPAVYVVNSDVAASWRRSVKENQEWQAKTASSNSARAASASARSSTSSGSSGVRRRSASAPSRRVVRRRAEATPTTTS